MAKDTYYFSHDYNARNDKKISALVREFKSAGYGIYWCTAEMMHEEGGQLEFDDLTISAISKDLNEEFDLVKRVIEKCVSTFKLFIISEDNILTASRVRRNLEKRKEISKIRSNAGKAGANAKQMQANAKQKVAKERKGKEIKGKEIKKGFNCNPVFSDFNGLPEMYINQSIELVRLVKNTKISLEVVTGMWEVFKTKELTGQNYYANEGKVYSHFLDYLKKQDFNNPNKPSQFSSSSPTMIQ